MCKVQRWRSTTSQGPRFARSFSYFSGLSQGTCCKSRREGSRKSDWLNFGPHRLAMWLWASAPTAVSLSFPLGQWDEEGLMGLRMDGCREHEHRRKGRLGDLRVSVSPCVWGWAWAWCTFLTQGACAL